jgi:uncharacterized protein YndB with AHSA1/START domain
MNEATTQSKPFVISRVFDAPLELVWQATTEPEHLMHWWGPAGMEMLSATVDLRPGGEYRYSTRLPDGNVMWGKWVYRKIDPPIRLESIVSFTDPEGNIIPHPWSPTWPLQMLSVMTLSEAGGKTTMEVTATAYDGSAAEVTTFEAGFESMTQGFTGTFNQLERWLQEMK